MATERLSLADVAYLRAERPGTPQHVALVGVLAAGTPGGDGTDPLRLRARQWLAAALPQAPRLRQVVRRRWPGPGRPVWVGDPGFALDRHLRVAEVDHPGDEAAFVRACLAVLAPVMDRRRPLWDLTLLPGLAGGEVGLVLRLHHAMADGVDALRLFDLLCGGQATAPEPRAAPARPLVARARALATQATALVAQLATVRPGPRTSLNRPVGPTHRLALLRLPLAPLRQTTRRHRATVNDAVLAAVAVALRQVLVARGETCEGPLHASVPVSLRPREGGGDRPGNRVGVLTVALPLDRPEPLAALARVADATRAAKERARRAGSLAATVGTLTLRVAPWLLRHQRLVHVFVTNLPGPAAPVRVAGADLLAAYPATMLSGNVTLSVAVLSYAGHLHIGVTADAQAWPDLTVFTTGLRQALDTLATQPPPP